MPGHGSADLLQQGGDGGVAPQKTGFQVGQMGEGRVAEEVGCGAVGDFGVDASGTGGGQAMGAKAQAKMEVIPGQHGQAVLFCRAAGSVRHYTRRQG